MLPPRTCLTWVGTRSSTRPWSARVGPSALPVHPAWSMPAAAGWRKSRPLVGGGVACQRVGPG